jgi:MATE family multidrug resistance protein
VQVVAAGALRGLRDTRVPMLFAAVGYWGIGLPVGLVLGFPLGLGASGVWIGLAAGLAVVAALLLRRWRRLASPATRGASAIAADAASWRPTAPGGGD